MVEDAHAVMRNPAALGRNPGRVITGAIVLAAHGIGHFARVDEMIKHSLIGRGFDAIVRPVTDRVRWPDKDRRHRQCVALQSGPGAVEAGGVVVERRRLAAGEFHWLPGIR